MYKIFTKCKQNIDKSDFIIPIIINLHKKIVKDF